MKATYDTVLVACARWEVDSITEWLIYHRHIGFDHVFLYCNDDDPRALYEEILPFLQGPDPFVHFYHFGLQGQQEQMYFHFINHHIRDCNWYLCSDIDEFLLMREYPHIGDYIASFPSSVDAICFHSFNAGPNGNITRPSGLAIHNFTRRADHAAPFTKNIVRASAVDASKLPSAVAGAFWHNSEIILNDGSCIVNALHENMRGYYFDIGNIWNRLGPDRSFQARLAASAFIYHIGMKSEQDATRRFERGVSGNFATQVFWRDLAESGAGKVSEYLEANHAVREGRLVEIWNDILAGAMRTQIVAPPAGRNLAPAGAAMQSSIGPWSLHQDIALDAAGPINGRPNGLHAHHTDDEPAPWWVVDLRAPARVSQVWIYNRVDHCKNRFRNFEMVGSLDCDDWRVLCIKDDDRPFGGVDGHPFIWSAAEDVVVRFIKISGIGVTHLDFAQVEVYGEWSAPSAVTTSVA
ncbi:hypothetical protein OPKNFCMD_4437 [Methylobacterium crusticola]|uniref:F5/8 type C domain-containing protein n=1 Tax=Methylobacterium crusticola TaxID=1697972 RepID=A0ABQ4R4M3_9HYPH|nr:glycosyltransferase family 2 protein [Methylobacterium crusticola]GJD51682.1 hypothetical protein OPKNFCMD_4437 [Methylobacterium crusticola]